jgi:hypothetical protein
MISGQLGRPMVLDLGQDCVERHLRLPGANQCVHALGQTVGADRSSVARDSLVEHKPADQGARSNRLEGTQGPEGMPDQIDRSRHGRRDRGHVRVLAARRVPRGVLAVAVAATVQRVHRGPALEQRAHRAERVTSVRQGAVHQQHRWP